MASQMAQIINQYRQGMPSGGLERGVQGFLQGKAMKEQGEVRDLQKEQAKLELFKEKYKGAIASANSKEKWLSAQNQGFLPKNMPFDAREPFLMGLTMDHAKAQGRIGTYNPRDYTVQSFAKFNETGNPAVLERYTEKTVDIGGVPHRLVPGTTNKYEPIETVEKVASNQAAIKSAVKQAEAQATQAVKEAGTQKTNDSAWNVYNAGMEGLVSGLEGTETGPFIGLIPSVTANQQIAEGAIAAMAPILKQMFRAAGEGTFTDKDQELLLDMIPTRRDKPEARASKLNNIDMIVRAKLGQNVEGDKKGDLPSTNEQGWQLMQDAAGNRAYVGPNGEVQEVQ